MSSTQPSIAEIVKEFLETYNRELSGSEEEKQLIKQLEAINSEK